jgi:hypothetical protein
MKLLQKTLFFLLASHALLKLFCVEVAMAVDGQPTLSKQDCSVH